MHHWFADPWALALLALLPALELAALIAWRRRRQALAQLGKREALRALISARPRLRLLRAGCLMGGLLLLVVGIAAPQWGRDRTPATLPGRDVVVVLDMSQSMLAADVAGRSWPNRLGRAKDALGDLVDSVQQSGGHRLALVVFAARARVVCPLTQDYDHFRDALGQLDPADPLIGPDPGAPEPPSDTRIGEGLQLGVQIQDSRFRGQQDILMISDGDDPAHDEEWRGGALDAREHDIPVHTIGVGDPDKGGRIPVKDGYLQYNGHDVWTRLEEKPLQEIARLTDGTYTPAQTKELPLGELFREKIEPRAGHEASEDLWTRYKQRYAWFFGAGLVLLVGEILAEGRRKLKIGRRG